MLIEVILYHYDRRTLQRYYEALHGVFSSDSYRFVLFSARLLRGQVRFYFA